MTLIAEAFVAVRPDLSDFAALLRTGLPKQIEKVGVKWRTINLVPVIDQKILKAELDKIRATEVIVQVIPELSPGAEALLIRKLETLPPVPVNVTAKMLGTEASVLGSQIGSQISKEAETAAKNATKAGAASAIAAAEVGAGGIAAGGMASSETLSAEQLARNRAATSLERTRNQQITQTRILQKATADLDAIEKKEGVTEQQITAKREAQAKAARDLAVTEQALTDKTDALALAEKKLSESQAKSTITPTGVAAGRVAAGSEAQTAAQQAASRAQVAQARIATLGSNVAGVESAGVQSSAALAAGTLTQARAKEELTKATNTAKAVEKEYTATVEAGTTAATEEEKLLITQRARDLELINAQAIAARKLAEANLIGTSVQEARALVAEAGALEGSVAGIHKAQQAKAQILALNDRLRGSQNALVAGYQREIAALAENSDAMVANAVATKEASSASARAANVASQAQRGAGATIAGMAGFRGAVLAASAPFLIATVAVTAFAKIVGQSGQLQQSLDIFRATAKATAEQMQQVSAKAIQLGADVKLPATSSVEAAKAMTELAKSGLSVVDVLNAVRPAMQLAAAAMISSVEAATAVASILNQFRLAGSEAGHVVDALANASISAQGTVKDFIEGFRVLGPTAHLVGLDIYQTTALLTELGRAGLAGAYGGTALKTMLIRLDPSTKAAIDAQKQLNIHLDQTRSIGQQLPALIEQYTQGLAKLSPLARQQTLVSIFGTRGIQAASVVLSQGAAAFLAFQQRVSEVGAATRLTDAHMAGLRGQSQALLATTKTFATTIGTDMLPALTGLVHGAINVVGAFTQIATAIHPIVAGISDIFKIIPGGGNLVGTLVVTIALAKGLQAAISYVSGAIIKANVAYYEQAAAAKAAGASGVVGADGAALAQKELAGAVATANTQLITQGVYLKDNTVAAVGEMTAIGAAGDIAARKLTGLKGLIPTTLKGALSSSALGVGLGIGATVAGSAVGGHAGSAISAAGQGAILGTLIEPGIGTAIGAAVFGAASLFSSFKSDAAKHAADVKSQWQSLSFEEQVAFLRQKFPSLPDPAVDYAGFLRQLSTDPRFGALTRPGRSGPITTPTPAAQFLQAQGGFAQLPVDQFANQVLTQVTGLGPTLDQTMAATELVAAKFGRLGKIVGDVQSGYRTVGGGLQLDPTLVMGPNGSFHKVYLTNNAFGQFNTQMGAFGVTLQGLSATTLQTAQDAAAVTSAENELKLELAKLGGNPLVNQSNIESVISQDISAMAAIQNQLAAVKPFSSRRPQQRGTPLDPFSLGPLLPGTGGVFATDVSQSIMKFAGQDRAKKIKEETAIVKNRIQAQTLLEQSVADQFAKQIDQANLAVSKAAAGVNSLTGQTNIDAIIAADEGIAKRQQAYLQKLQALNKKYPLSITSADVLKQQIAATDAQNKVIQETITAQSDALSAQQAGIQNAADLAGNVGSQENALIALLQKRVGMTQKNTTAYWNAVSALQSEVSKRSQAQISLLSTIAGLAGNVGPQEDKLIKALQDQVKAAQRNTPAYWTAVANLQAAQTTQAQAIQSFLQSGFDLTNARDATKLAAAQYKDLVSGGTGNQTSVYRLILRDQNIQLRTLEALAKHAGSVKNTSKSAYDAWVTAQKNVFALQAQIFATKTSLRNLTGTSSFSLSDLFKEAVNEFNQFGSNIASRGGLFTGGDVRAKFAANIQANIVSAQRNPVADAISSSAGKNLNEAQKQTALLQKIADELTSPKAKKQLQKHPTAAIYPVMAEAQVIATIKRGGNR